MMDAAIAITVQIGEDGPVETSTLDAFLAENAEALSESDVAELRAALDESSPFFCGGGAGPLVTVRRAAP